MQFRDVVPSIGYVQWLSLGHAGTLYDFFRWLELLEARDVLYDSGVSGLSAGDVQTAIDVLARDKELFQKTVFKDVEIPAVPVSGHYPETGAVKSYVDGVKVELQNSIESAVQGLSPSSPELPGPPGLPGDGFFDISALPNNVILGIKNGELHAFSIEELGISGIELLTDLSGDDLPATKNSGKPYHGLTINQYADLAPGAWTGTSSAFNSVEAVPQNAGTYFVKE